MITFRNPALIMLFMAIAALGSGQQSQSDFVGRVLAAARAEVTSGTPYIMEYKVIKYPMGDVPEGTGVCTDLIIRSFRGVGIDLQELVHKDRKANPSRYPTSLWDAKAADRNIDHRRCPNLVTYFRKTAQELTPKTDRENLASWLPGDIVFYVYEGAKHPWHVGLVSDKKDTDGMPFIIDSYPPRTSESHRLDDFAPIHSHFRIRATGE